MRNLPIRYCEQCGKQLVKKRQDSVARAAGRRFCSVECAADAKRKVMPTKQCVVCGATFARRAESTAQWDKRQYCSYSCRNRDRKLREYVAPAPVAPRCECGHPSTKRVHFTQATADGWRIPGHLDVCADCYDYIMESDPGASAGPQIGRGTNAGKLWDDDAQHPHTLPTGGFANRRTYHD